MIQTKGLLGDSGMSNVFEKSKAIVEYPFSMRVGKDNFALLQLYPQNHLKGILDI